MFILLLGLSGFPFMGLYFRKHVFLSSVVSMSYFRIIFLLFVIVGLMLSRAYSVRLFIIFFGGLTFGCYTTRMCFYIVLIVPMIGTFLGYHLSFSLFNYFSGFMSLLRLFILLLGLSGFPFMGLYFRKHVFLSSVVSMSYFRIIFLLFVIVGLMLSRAYSVRLFIIFFGGLTFGCYTTRMCFYIVLIVPMIGTFLGYHLSFSLFNYFSGFMSLLSFKICCLGFIYY
ncbi:hypothetical protein MN116_000307 [Schistosoma mekongi]|uniref:NADH dehydrogenase subunit 5 n=1 Tax=Schistosoma mekongi TaxID=38744 RepID=A0AAE1Z4X1_SCHME|nr:hypothetical protein MN116_000307 [Schistosoma mekongi]